MNDDVEAVIKLAKELWPGAEGGRVCHCESYAFGEAEQARFGWQVRAWRRRDTFGFQYDRFECFADSLPALRAKLEAMKGAEQPQ